MESFSAIFMSYLFATAESRHRKIASQEVDEETASGFPGGRDGL
jgi:hypothetical protein